MREWLHHGGKLATARQYFDLEEAAWLDLSTGINPHPWPGAAEIVTDWRALPDDGQLNALEQEAARFFGADPECICAVPGSEIGLRLLSRIGLPAGGLVATPGYGTHREIFPNARPVPRAELEAIALPERSIVIANPNNPDGSDTPPDILRRWAETLIPHHSWLIVDEAFGDVDPSLSVASAVGTSLPLIVSRSFGKFFGLAGIRLGFIIAPPLQIATLRGLLGSWPISTAAIAIGRAAYADHAWIAATRTRLHNDAAALDDVLRRHGFAPEGNCPLFRLIRCDAAHELFENLARNAILTRPFDYDRSWLRIGLPGSPQGLEKLDRALRDG